jgi:hypothetical protein
MGSISFSGPIHSRAAAFAAVTSSCSSIRINQIWSW